MITVDLHSHTAHSHGKNTVAEMFAAGQKKGLELHGFSEHSPRPEGYDYPVEYREKLSRGFPDYVAQVQELAVHTSGAVLLGIEADWIGAERSFIERMLASYPFDYALGSVHFLGHWGFDFQASDWEGLDTTARFAVYDAYFTAMAEMVDSRLFQIMSHPDLIKVFSHSTFSQWISLPQSREQVRRVLAAAGEAGMAMEISSAGLRKLCKEIYPCPAIMEIAASLGVPVTFGSDAHNVADMAYGFDQLEAYAKSFGYTHSVWYGKGKVQQRKF